MKRKEVARLREEEEQKVLRNKNSKIRITYLINIFKM
jgi:hypothetical protein